MKTEEGDEADAGAGLEEGTMFEEGFRTESEAYKGVESEEEILSELAICTKSEASIGTTNAFLLLS